MKKKNRRKGERTRNIVSVWLLKHINLTGNGALCNAKKEYKDLYAFSDYEWDFTLDRSYAKHTAKCKPFNPLRISQFIFPFVFLFTSGFYTIHVCTDSFLLFFSSVFFFFFHFFLIFYFIVVFSSFSNRFDVIRSFVAKVEYNVWMEKLGTTIEALHRESVYIHVMHKHTLAQFSFFSAMLKLSFV